MTYSNLILIGMPGSGKSTLGVILAKYLSKSFIDTDLLIQIQYQMPLQQIIHAHGHMKLREYEEQVILQLSPHNAVIATGGSAVYSSRAIDHLKKDGIVVYLDVAIEDLQRRIRNYNTRGIASPANVSFEEIFEERTALYKRYADITICCKKNTHEEVVQNIIGNLSVIPRQ